MRTPVYPSNRQQHSRAFWKPWMLEIFQPQCSLVRLSTPFAMNNTDSVDVPRHFQFLWENWICRTVNLCWGCLCYCPVDLYTICMMMHSLFWMWQLRWHIFANFTDWGPSHLFDYIWFKIKPLWCSFEPNVVIHFDELVPAIRSHSVQIWTFYFVFLECTF